MPAAFEALQKVEIVPVKESAKKAEPVSDNEFVKEGTQEASAKTAPKTEEAKSVEIKPVEKAEQAAEDKDTSVTKEEVKEEAETSKSAKTEAAEKTVEEKVTPAEQTTEANKEESEKVEVEVTEVKKEKKAPPKFDVKTLFESIRPDVRGSKKQ